jgi:cytochrome c-type biogenesis protein CcmH
MSAFVALAALMVSLAAAAITVPLLRSRRSGERPARWAALISVAGLIVGATLLYANWSNWSWTPAAAATTPAEMVAKLARRLESSPDDLDGWLMLGRSYAALEEYPPALRAYERANRLAGGSSPEALVGIAETLTLQDESAIDGRAGQLFEQALALAPASGKALFFSAVAASRRGDLPLARERFARLLALNPPPEIRAVLERQISMIDERLGGQAPGGAQGPPSRQATVAVNVRLSPSLRAQGNGAPLFVMIRDPAAPGPPLAARQLASTFPQRVELTPRDAMVAGRTFHAGQTVQVVARIARGGTPIAQRGDPFGELKYAVGVDGLRDIVIDRLSP